MRIITGLVLTVFYLTGALVSLFMATIPISISSRIFLPLPNHIYSFTNDYTTHTGICYTRTAPNNLSKPQSQVRFPFQSSKIILIHLSPYLLYLSSWAIPKICMEHPPQHYAFPISISKKDRVLSAKLPSLSQRCKVEDRCLLYKYFFKK